MDGPTLREWLRRTAIWSSVAVFGVCAVLDIVVFGRTFLLAGWTGFAVVGALILTLRPRNGVGRVLLAVALLWSAVTACFVLVEALGTRAPLPMLVSLSILGNLAGVFAWITFLLLVPLFPSGRIQTRWGRLIVAFLGAIAVLTVAACALVPVPSTDRLTEPWMLYGLGTTTGPDGILLNLGVPLIIALEFVELSFRWKRSNENERFQYRWFAFGCAVVIVLMLGFLLWQAVEPSITDAATELASPAVLPVNAIPISVGIAVLRYGLYEVGRVVSSTISYVVVTAAAVVVYSIVVTSITWLLPDAPAFAVATATLAAAALFLPVLRRVQASVDRRFDRERYDAQQVVEAFGERVRTGADPSATGDALLAAVTDAIRPVSSGLWVNGDPP